MHDPVSVVYVRDWLYYSYDFLIPLPVDLFFSYILIHG